ncbi:MAG: VWA domain-containing protein, partial [Selenomonas massiliensis]
KFVFLGANIDAVQVAGGLGIRAENAVEFACDAAGVRENFASLSHMTCAFAATGTVVSTWSRKISEHLTKTQSGRS